jgi:hypothetical protein
MPRYAIDFTLKGRIEIDAKSEEHAHDIVNEYDWDLLVHDVDRLDVEGIEEVPDYRDDFNE